MTDTVQKVAIVTGGARGMGAAHARALVARGFQVVIGDVLEAEGAATAAEIGPDCVFCRLDVTRPESWTEIVDTALTHFGRIDGLVNNAGILLDETLETATLESWQRTIAVNQTGPFLGMQAVLPHLRAVGGGSIVNISSTAGLVGYTDAFSYVGTKWAVRGITKAAALELGRDGIRVNSIHPGDTETPMIAGAISESGAVLSPSEIPLGRYGQPSDIANLVAFLLDDVSSYISGAEIAIDGATTAGIHYPK
ncbi:glucose 1-dehydrogenase [Leucobacter japonicus]|uniref:glucose 1-dehydrogenase n=1 Tax=Leucobacter japonicus TaxID=1461259 RepID=UPI0006A7D40A|nr:glucose 1-dehydrogenase [Leucobacter japonicus]